MSAQGWQLGDKALIEVEVGVVRPDVSLVAVGGSVVGVPTADLLPVPAPADDTIERAARKFVAEIAGRLHHVETHYVPDGHCKPMPTVDVLRDFDRLTALASPVPGRSEAEEFARPPWPRCKNHLEVQHRDGKPPWCDRCGWSHGRPAVPAQQIRAAQVSDTEGTD